MRPGLAALALLMALPHPALAWTLARLPAEPVPFLRLSAEGGAFLCDEGGGRVELWLERTASAHEPGAALNVTLATGGFSRAVPAQVVRNTDFDGIRAELPADDPLWSALPDAPALAVTVPQAAAILMPVLLLMDVLGMAAFRKDFDLQLLRFLLPFGLLGLAVATKVATKGIVERRPFGRGAGAPPGGRPVFLGTDVDKRGRRFIRLHRLPPWPKVALLHPAPASTGQRLSHGPRHKYRRAAGAPENPVWPRDPPEPSHFPQSSPGPSGLHAR